MEMAKTNFVCIRKMFDLHVLCHVSYLYKIKLINMNRLFGLHFLLVTS